ncbi:MAG: hypothetical protein QOF91_2806 [Alphaproteobacteria bacterium]|nr:hypothetical protein [Alphaproteobacteria bacterium]
MSRRITFFVLAASAALVATQAAADPECFGESCRLLEAAEPAASAVSPPDANDAAAPEANAAVPETHAAAPKLAPAKAPPQITAEPAMGAPLPPIRSLAEGTSAPRAPVRPAPAKAPARMAADPVMRAPVPTMQSTADETSVPREPVRPAPRYLKDAPPAPPARVTNAPPADYARSVRVSSPDPDYVLGINSALVGGVVVVVPGGFYTTGRYLIAPSAKIISIDTDD